MLNHDKGNTFKVILGILKSLDYTLEIEQLNSKDYGIPQNRNRLFIVGFRKDLNIGTFSFPNPKVLTKKVSDYLEETVDREYFYAEKSFKVVIKKKV